jgi:hypothetical protein
METAEISRHQVAMYLFVKGAKGWVTSRDIEEGAGVCGSSARHFAKKLVDMGIFDVAEVFPGHRYRLSSLASKRNKSMVVRFETAASVFGMDE